MYGYKIKSKHSYKETIEKTKSELMKEGFGVLTEIDVKETLKKKLDVDFENYIILGACNPSFALKALQAEHEIGLMLPCNVIVYDKDGDTFVSAILPATAMGMINNEELQAIAMQVEEKLKAVINNI